MYRTLAIYCLLTIFHFSAKGQNVEFRINSAFSIDPANNDAKTEWNPTEFYANGYQFNVDVRYRFLTAKKINPFIGIGLKNVFNNYYINLQSREFGYNIKAIKFSQRHAGLSLLLGSEWKFNNRNALGFQYEWQYNAGTKTEIISTDGTETNVFGSLEFDYSLTSKALNYNSNLFSIYLKTRLNPVYFLTAGFGYEFRPISGMFDFTTNQIQTLTDANTGATTQIQSSYNIPNKEIQYNLFYFNLGITRLLIWK